MSNFKQLGLGLFCLLMLMAAACKKDKDSGLQYGSVTDIDGNIYKTIKIGEQEWMAENLKVTHYNTGTTAQDEIPLVLDEQQWSDFGSFLSTGAYCYYDKDQNNLAKYGALYNWYAASSGKLAPAGWHVPTDADWTKLRMYLIANGFNADGSSVSDKIAKSLASKNGWTLSQTPETPGNNPLLNNKSGFNAIPAAGRNYDGQFDGEGLFTNFWSSTSNDPSEENFRTIYNSLADLPQIIISQHGYGSYVRCVKD